MEALTTAELIRHLEQLSPVELEKEIAEIEDQLGMMRRLLAIINGEPLNMTPRSRMVAAETPADPKPSIDRDRTPQERIIAHLTAYGPSSYQQLSRIAGLKSTDLVTTLQDMPNVRQNDDRLYFLMSEKSR